MALAGTGPGGGGGGRLSVARKAAPVMPLPWPESLEEPGMLPAGALLAKYSSICCSLGGTGRLPMALARTAAEGCTAPAGAALAGRSIGCVPAATLGGGAFTLTLAGSAFAGTGGNMAGSVTGTYLLVALVAMNVATYCPAPDDDASLDS